MKDPFNNQLVNDIRNILNEELPNGEPFKLTIPNSKVARYLDYSKSMEIPDVHISGLGVYSIDFLKKAIKEDLARFSDQIGRMDAQRLLVHLTDFDGRKTSGMYFAYKLYGLMEIEEFLKNPAVKRKLSLMKKKKQSGG